AVEKPHAVRRSPGGMLVDSGLDTDPAAVRGAATRPAQRSVGLPVTGGDEMTVAVELHEPPARRPCVVPYHAAPALHAHGRFDVVQREGEGLDARRVERDDLRPLEPRTEPGQGARVHGLDDDTIRACVSS